MYCVLHAHKTAGENDKKKKILCKARFSQYLSKCHIWQLRVNLGRYQHYFHAFLKQVMMFELSPRGGFYQRGLQKKEGQILGAW